MSSSRFNAVMSGMASGPSASRMRRSNATAFGVNQEEIYIPKAGMRSAEAAFRINRTRSCTNAKVRYPVAANLWRHPGRDIAPISFLDQIARRDKRVNLIKGRRIQFRLEASLHLIELLERARTQDH
jgi:hypothetical protein